MAELSLAENKSTDPSVSFIDEYCNRANDRGYAASDKYCNHTNDRGYAAFHEELHPDVIRGTLRGLSDKFVQRRVTNLSRNKTIEKVTLYRCTNRETLACESDDFIFQFHLKKCILQHWFVKQDCRKMTALENEAVFVVRTGLRRIHPSTQKSWSSSRVVLILPSRQLLRNIFTLIETLTFVHTQC